MASTMQEAFTTAKTDPLIFTNSFPFRCVLDRVLVEEIPIDESKIHLPGLDLQRSERFIKRSDRARVLAVGQGVPMGSVIMPMPYKVGDIIICSEFGRDPFYLHPEDEFDKSIPRRYLIRVADTKGCIL